MKAQWLVALQYPGLGRIPATPRHGHAFTDGPCAILIGISRLGCLFRKAMASAGLSVALMGPMAASADSNPLLQPDAYEAGHGSISLSFQSIDVNRFNTAITDVDIGKVTTHSLYLEVEHSFSERWKVEAGLPWIQKKYDGPARHDPLLLSPPRPEVPFLDDGAYHGGFQDLFIGVHRLLDVQPVMLEPFLHLYIPTRDYPHFAQAAIGQNLWKMELGLQATQLMPFSDWYYRVDASYTIVEETLGINVNHFRLGGEVGYFFTPGFSAHAVVHAKDGRGDKASRFPPPARTDERWYQHDRTTRHSYVNVGLGADWQASEHYQFTAEAFQTVWGDSVHLIDWALNLGMTRYY